MSAIAGSEDTDGPSVPACNTTVGVYDDLF